MSEKPTETPSRPESPTTAREPDWNDDDNGTAADKPAEKPASPAPKKVSFQEDEAPPAKPPRPMSPQAQAEATLIEAFPSMDAKVVKAVLVASGGRVEPAFNALLSMSDPDFQQDDTPPPPQPPRPTQAQRQLEQDEQYARQLAQHFQNQASAPGYGAYGSQTRGDPALPEQRRQGNLRPNELYDDDDREHSFFDDDLPEIRKNIEKGFQDTQVTVNKWFNDLKKKFNEATDEGDDETPPPQPPRRQNFGPSQSNQMYGIRKSAESRRSAERDRYDSDPRVLDDDFTQLELRDEEAPQKRGSGRPLANPDLFKSTPMAPQSGPVDEVDALYRQPTPTNRQPSPGTGKGGKKWQPLTSVAPNPESEDNDPFSLGDSDDEDSKNKDIKAEDTERLKKQASNVATVEDGSEGEGTKKMQESERSGSVDQKDKAAEELLAAAK
ncbi:hypothetical protein K402DRAFT_347858 [Aulographum hederae CBS 113979]|uniref:CUE domain-containing protein n=1 Tax=Aulographum hederae CBS 113979 TaxID=1176131 RepID=A0A6G1HCC2_9PEZI|nr:hypothetical protein K402DRAFT_347858 [Aulographum hederae CBS 113979]